MDFLKASGAMLATTMGAGIFAIPALLPQAGWLLTLVYALVLGALISIAHDIYLRVRINKLNEGLLKIVSEAWGGPVYYFSFLVVAGGLLLTLLIYLILGGSFLSVLFSGAEMSYLVLAMWFLGVLPFVFSAKRILSIELFGALAMTGLIVFVLMSAPELNNLFSLPLMRAEGMFLPFGVLLFSLAGWTAVEPTEDGLGLAKNLPKLNEALVVGTFSAVILYALFSMGVIGSGGGYVEGGFILENWGRGEQIIFSILGLVLVLTSFWPIALETKRSFSEINFSGTWSGVITFGGPLLLYFLGWQSMLSVMEVTGGVFLSIQYFLIVILGLKFLRLSKLERWGFRVLSFVFLLGILAAINSWLF